MDVMNKYQEALDILVNAKFCSNAEHEKLVNEAIETLQELVDEEHCEICDQRIDWSEDE